MRKYFVSKKSALYYHDVPSEVFFYLKANSTIKSSNIVSNVPKSISKKCRKITVVLTVLLNSNRNGKKPSYLKKTPHHNYRTTCVLTLKKKNSEEIILKNPYRYVNVT